MNKLRLLELFGGIGACSSALTRLGIDYEIADYVEIDKYAVKSYNAIHGTKFEPQDICKWDKDIEVDLIMHGSPCVTEDSLILTRDGYKEYRDLQIGDYVLTKSNTWQKIAKKFDNGIHKTYYLQGMGFENIHCTSNHKFYVREKYRKGHKSIRCFKEPVFKEVKDITKNDYFGVPVIQEEEIFYRDDLDFWYMIGYYLGDGWLSSTSNDIILACNDTKLEKLKNHLAIDKWKYTYHWNGSCYRFRFASKEIYDFIKTYIGTGSFEKRICGEILRLPKEQLNALLEGYIDSDGCRLKKYIQFSSVNRKLIYGISIIINKVYHRPTCISKNIVSPTKVIDGREVNQHDWYLLRFKPMSDKQDHAFYEDNYIWYPFDKILDGKEEHVYNMEIENDHSYIIQGCISKNCQDFSLAGKQAGGDKDSGTRSSLMYETIRIVEKLKPKYVIWENVKNLISKKHRHNFDAYLETMESLGYTNYYQVLNAKDYGIPQNRERVFTVSILGNENYEFPKGKENNNKIDRIFNFSARQDCRVVYDENGLCPTLVAGMGQGGGKVPMFIEKPFVFPPKQELKLKLKDMLEDEVDEKYYLTNSMIEYLENGKYQSAKVSSKLKQTDTGICPTLDTMQGGNRQPFIKSKCKRLESLVNKTNFEQGKILNMDLYNQTTNENISQCLTEPHHNSQRLFYGLRIRKLTPKECWRLMGFTDEEFEKAEKVNSNSQLYKQAGNSICVPVLIAILNNLLKGD